MKQIRLKNEEVNKKNEEGVFPHLGGNFPFPKQPLGKIPPLPPPQKKTVVVVGGVESCAAPYIFLEG